MSAWYIYLDATELKFIPRFNECISNKIIWLHVHLMYFNLHYYVLDHFLCIIVYVGDVDYNSTSIVLTFNKSISVQRINMLFHNDDLVETDETFTLSLSLLNQDFRNVLIVQNEAVVTILDTDCKSYILTYSHRLCSSRENSYYD